MELLLGLVVLSHVWELVGELVEVTDELGEHLLRTIKSVPEGQELLLGAVEVVLDLLPLDSLLLEGLDHLLAIGH